MANKFQHKRGTTARRLLYTPADGELIYDKDMNKIFVGDGSTVGGIGLEAEDKTKITKGEFGLGLSDGENTSSLNATTIDDPAVWHSGIYRYTDPLIPGQYGHMLRLGGGSAGVNNGWFNDIAFSTAGGVASRYRANTAAWSSWITHITSLNIGSQAVASAAKLTTARTIGGVSFNGTANINLPGVNTTGNQNTTGNAATATKLATARTLNGVSFDGSANVTVPVPVTSISTNGVDLNTYQTPGMHSCSANAVAATLLNCPTTNAFSLLVERHAGIKQTLTEYMASGAKTYSRNFYGSWGAWYRVYTTIDAPTSVTGNAGTATKLATARTVSLTGDVTGSVSFDGSANASITSTIANKGVANGLATLDATGKVPADQLPTPAISAQYLGTASTKAISYNAQTIDENIVIPGNVNALSAGPLTIGDGYTVTISDGAVWTIV